MRGESKGRLELPSIRVATSDDGASLLSLWRGAGSEPSHTDDLKSVAELIAHDPGAVIVAALGGELVGSVIAGWDGWRGSIYRLAVAPSHRRRGLALRLLGAAEERFAELGAVRLQAIVVESDLGATSFWSATRWERQTDRVRFVKG